MRNSVELSRNGSIACRQLELAHRGAIKLVQPGAGTKSRLKYAAPTSDISVLGDREILVIASTPERDRANDEVVVAGLWWVGSSVPALWQHDDACPIGRAWPSMGSDGNLHARIVFAPEHASAVADMACNLAKCGTIDGISIGFDPHTVEPVSAQQPRSGTRFLTGELLEISLVSVGANSSARVVARSKHFHPGTVRSRSNSAHVLDVLQNKAIAAASISSCHAVAAARELATRRCLAVSGMSYQAPAPSRSEARRRAAEIYESLLKAGV